MGILRILAVTQLLLCALTAGTSHADHYQPGNEDKGVALGFQVGRTFQIDEDEQDNGPYNNDPNTFQLTASYLPMPSLELRLGASTIDQRSGQDVFVLAAAQFNFKNDAKLSPFIGAAWETQAWDDGDDTDWASVYCGARYYFHANMALRTELAYHTTTESDIADIEGIRLGVGLEWLF